MRPGPKMGMLLDRLLEDVLEEPSRNTVEYLLGRASEILPGLPDLKPKKTQA